MIIHKYKGWGLTITGRVVHLCSALPNNIALISPTIDNNFIWHCSTCNERLPREIMNHLLTVKKFADISYTI